MIGGYIGDPIGSVYIDQDTIITKALAIVGLSAAPISGRTVYERATAAAAVSTFAASWRIIPKRVSLAIDAVSAGTVTAYQLVRKAFTPAAVATVQPTGYALRCGAILPAATSAASAFTGRAVRLGTIAVATVSSFAAYWRIIPLRVSLAIEAISAAAITGYRMTCAQISVAAICAVLAKPRFLWNTATEENEPWSIVTKQEEAWTPATKQQETWTTRNRYA